MARLRMYWRVQGQVRYTLKGNQAEWEEQLGMEAGGP
jgi:hypothetical protein